MARFRRASRTDGVTQVKTFYDQDGWQWVDGQSGDQRRWGGTAPRGTIQQQLDEHRHELLRRVLGLDRPAAGARSVAMVEFGGGGQPAVHLLDGVSSYTAVDLSGEGLKAARAAVEPLGVDAKYIEADVRSVPLPDEQFDVAYSAHMIYHLPTADDQRRALREMARVVRPGGVLAVVGANPYPWLFPWRCVGAVLDTPILGALVNAVRRPPRLPYLPMSSTWMCEVLAPFGTTKVYPFGVPTSAFNRRVGEARSAGRLVWQGIYRLETQRPELARRIGSFTLVVLEKTAG
jgi:SAM-dependent methyltransferase